MAVMLFSDCSSVGSPAWAAASAKGLLFWRAVKIVLENQESMLMVYILHYKLFALKEELF